MKITVIIATYNRAESLGRTLDSFEKMTAIEDAHVFDVLVVDNNSRDRTKSVVEEFQRNSCSVISYIFEPKQGKPYALNTGLKSFKGDIVVFTDDDVSFDPNWLKAIVKNFEDTSIDGVTGRILPADKFPALPWYSDKLSSVLVKIDYSKERIPTTQVTGANMAFRKCVLEKVGGFDVHPGLINEDTFLSKKLVAHNFKIIYDPAMLVYHHFDPARFTKAYFRKWYWLSGIALAEINKEDDEKTVRKVLGMPIWRYREILDSLKGFSANIFNAKERFFHEVWLRRRIGYCWRRWKTLKGKKNA